MALLAFTSWALWNGRNQIRTNQNACPLNQIMNTSKERKQEFQILNPGAPRQHHRKHMKWKPLATDLLKVNYDGAIFQDQGRAGIGMVIRNSEGAVMASLSQQIPLPTTVAQVEAMVARRAVEFVVELGVTRAIIEGDSETICNELSNPSPSLALHGLLIKDAQQLATAVTDISFSHVCRQGNMVAHSLARRAILNQNLIVWMEEVPPDIHQFV